MVDHLLAEEEVELEVALGLNEVTYIVLELEVPALVVFLLQLVLEFEVLVEVFARLLFIFLELILGYVRAHALQALLVLHPHV